MRRPPLIRIALATALVLGLAVAAGWSPAAAGGGDFLQSVRDRYEPGETAVMVAYTAALPAGQPGAVDAGPYYGHLRADPAAAEAAAPDTWPFVHPSDVPLGPTTVTETGRRDQFAVRLSITFTVPAGLAPGDYEVFVCDDPCTTTLGFIAGGSLYVGVDPPVRVDRAWLIDDPAIAGLDGDETVAGIPVDRIRAGQAGTPWYDAHLTDPPPPTTEASVRADRPATSAGPATTAPPRAGGVPARDGSGPREVGLADAAPWLVAVGAVAAVSWLASRRRRRSPMGAPRPSSARPTAAAAGPTGSTARSTVVTPTAAAAGLDDEPAPGEALTSARS